MSQAFFNDDFYTNTADKCVYEQPLSSYFDERDSDNTQSIDDSQDILLDSLDQDTLSQKRNAQLEDSLTKASQSRW